MKIVVALDLTGAAEQIVLSIAKRRWQPDTEFKLLTVLEPLKHLASREKVKQCQIAQLESKRHEIALLKLSKLRKTLQDSLSDCHVHTDIRTGPAREEIVKASGEWMADKLIAGAHGHADNRLLGSTPRRLVEETPCTVELVRLNTEPTEAYR